MHCDVHASSIACTLIDVLQTNLPLLLLFTNIFSSSSVDCRVARLLAELALCTQHRQQQGQQQQSSPATAVAAAAATC
jgi:hypothetical protein